MLGKFNGHLISRKHTDQNGVLLPEFFKKQIHEIYVEINYSGVTYVMKLIFEFCNFFNFRILVPPWERRIYRTWHDDNLQRVVFIRNARVYFCMNA